MAQALDPGAPPPGPLAHLALMDEGDQRLLAAIVLVLIIVISEALHPDHRRKKDE